MIYLQKAGILLPLKHVEGGFVLFANFGGLADINNEFSVLQLLETGVVVIDVEVSSDDDHCKFTCLRHDFFDVRDEDNHAFTTRNFRNVVKMRIEEGDCLLVFEVGEQAPCHHTRQGGAVVGLELLTRKPDVAAVDATVLILAVEDADLFVLVFRGTSTAPEIGVLVDEGLLQEIALQGCQLLQAHEVGPVPVDYVEHHVLAGVPVAQVVVDVEGHHG